MLNSVSTPSRLFRLIPAIVLTLTITMWSTASLAIDFSQPLVDEQGQPLKDGPSGQPTTLGLAVARALYASYPDEKDQPPGEDFRRGTLAMKIQNAKELVLTSEEVALVKKLVEKAYAPLIVVQVWKMVDPAMSAPAPAPEEKE